MKYTVKIGFHDEFVFEDGKQALAFADCAIEHSGTRDKQIEIEIIKADDQEEKPADKKPDATE